MKKKEKILSLAFMIGLLFLETNNLKASVPIDYFVDIVKEFEVKREAIPALAKKLKIITTKAIPSIDELAKNPINAKRISDLIRNVLRRMTPAEVKGIVKAAQTKAAVLVAAEAARVAKAALVVEKQAEIAKYTGFFELNPKTRLFEPYKGEPDFSLRLAKTIQKLKNPKVAVAIIAVVVVTAVASVSLYYIIKALTDKNFQFIRLDLPPGIYEFILEGIPGTKKKSFVVFINEEKMPIPLGGENIDFLKEIGKSGLTEYSITPEANIRIDGANWCYSKLTVEALSGLPPDVPKEEEYPWPGPLVVQKSGKTIGQKAIAHVGQDNKCIRHFWSVFAEKDPKGKLVLKAEWDGNFFDKEHPAEVRYIHGIDIMQDLLKYDGEYKFTMSGTGKSKSWRVLVKDKRVRKIIPEASTKQDFFNFDFEYYKKSKSIEIDPNKWTEAVKKARSEKKKEEVVLVSDIPFYMGAKNFRKAERKIKKLPLGEKLLYLDEKQRGRIHDYQIIFNGKGWSLSKLTVEVLSGPLKGQKASDEKGRALLGGRTFAVGIIECPLTGKQPKLFVKAIK